MRCWGSPPAVNLVAVPNPPDPLPISTATFEESVVTARSALPSRLKFVLVIPRVELGMLPTGNSPGRCETSGAVIQQYRDVIQSLVGRGKVWLGFAVEV